MDAVNTLGLGHLLVTSLTLDPDRVGTNGVIIRADLSETQMATLCCRHVPAAGRVREGLLALHRLFARGVDDGPEADAIRDALDGSFHEMSPEEHLAAQAFSERLYGTAPCPRCGDLVDGGGTHPSSELRECPVERGGP